MSDELRPDERATLNEAIARGWLVSSGQRFPVIRAFRRACRRRDVPCVEIRTGIRFARVLVDDRQVWRGKHGDAPDVAQGHARRVDSGPCPEPGTMRVLPE